MDTSKLPTEAYSENLLSWRPFVSAPKTTDVFRKINFYKKIKIDLSIACVQL